MNKYRSHNCSELTEHDSDKNTVLFISFSFNSEQLCVLYLFIGLILFLLD